METTAIDSKTLVEQASTYVYRLFKERLPENVLYHTYQHTVEVAKEAARIARNEELDEESMLAVMLAAWFHDAGFTETYDGHEEAGVRIATEYLSEQGLPEGFQARVAALIRSTHSDHEPETAAERALHDADLAHVGKSRKFFRYSARLRKEWELQRNCTFSDQEWAEMQMEFIKGVSFKTEYARGRFEETRMRNLRVIQEKLAEMLDAERPLPTAEPDRVVPSRGIETMFRTTYRTHINLSSIADSKANIMISINAILMSIIVSFVTTRLQEDPWLLVPAACMLLTSLIAIIFAILSARPNVTSRSFTLEDVRRNRANILFFGNFVKMPLDEFVVGVRELMMDWDKLYSTMTHDIYALGQVLSRKYRMLWISYTVFMGGLVVTVAVFLVLYYAGI